MTLREAQEILEAEVIVGHDRLDLEIKEAGCADLVNEIPVFGKPGMVLVTGLTNPQVVRAARDIDVAAIIIARGKRPLAETIRLAEELQIPVLTTRYILFETAGRLYVNGIAAPGCAAK